MLCLEQAALLSASAEVRFAALVHDLGKGITPEALWPHHYGHEQKGLAVLKALCMRLRTPNSFRSLAQQVMRYHTHCHKVFELRAATLTDMLADLGAFKSENTLLDQFLIACEADAKGRTGFETILYRQADFVRKAAQAAAAIDVSDILGRETEGRKIGAAIRHRRIEAVATAIQSFNLAEKIVV
jgi:tRNA nucleotidyltransferase (CCA-adding enzyme)